MPGHILDLLSQNQLYSPLSPWSTDSFPPARPGPAGCLRLNARLLAGIGPMNIFWISYFQAAKERALARSFMSLLRQSRRMQHVLRSFRVAPYERPLSVTRYSRLSWPVNSSFAELPLNFSMASRTLAFIRSRYLHLPSPSSATTNTMTNMSGWSLR